MSIVLKKAAWSAFAMKRCNPAGTLPVRSICCDITSDARSEFCLLPRDDERKPNNAMKSLCFAAISRRISPRRRRKKVMLPARQKPAVLERFEPIFRLFESAGNKITKSGACGATKQVKFC